MLTTYSIGGKIYESLYSSNMNLTSWSSTWHKNALRRWQQPGDVTDVPRIEYSASTIANDRYLLDASYFAIKNITLSYDLPRTLLSKAGISGAKVFGSIDNLALFSHLNGMDPQYNFSGGTNYSYSPQPHLSTGYRAALLKNRSPRSPKGVETSCMTIAFAPAHS